MIAMGTLHSDSNWKFYGSKEPYFGVTGLEKHLVENLGEQITDDFFLSGSADVENLFATIHSKIDPGFKAERILDFGCGPGRMVIPFARHAKEVVGMDVSQHMIEEALKNCARYNITNASFQLSDDHLTALKNQEFDLVHSFIVIQHINIKRGEKIIEHLLETIKSGGIGVLHMTYHDAYPLRRPVNYFRFRIPFLYDLLVRIRNLVKHKKTRKLPLMQMNNYNINKVLALLQKNGVTDINISFTNHYNYWGVILTFKKP
jgi:ubiquinone/menaquinone biosynthesis C-methylase UbiE